jgi:Putative DNA-binding domain
MEPELSNPVDLFQTNPQSLTDTELYEAVRTLTRIEKPLEERPQESTRLEFKQEWNDNALQSVAAFANTFGGLIILGISNERGRPGGIVGLKADFEQQTRIANSIATGISPTPPIQIGECFLPGDTHKSICVVRVLGSSELYYLLKGDKPVYWRSQTRSIPADAAQLRALIAQRVLKPSTPSTVSSRLQSVESFVSFPAGNPPVMAVYLAPSAPLRLKLDSSWEQSFLQILKSRFVELWGSIQEGEAEWLEARNRDWYTCRWTGVHAPIARAWVITDSGGYGFMSTLQGTGSENQYWSLADAAVDLILSLEHIEEFWKLCGYYGEAECKVLITNVGKSTLRLLESEYPVGYSNIAYRHWESLSKDIIRSSGSSIDIGTGSLELTFASLNDDLDATSASLLNQILRCMNYSVDVAALKREMAHVIKKEKASKNNSQIRTRLKLRINRIPGKSPP